MANVSDVLSANSNWFLRAEDFGLDYIFCIYFVFKSNLANIRRWFAASSVLAKKKRCGNLPWERGFNLGLVCSGVL